MLFHSFVNQESLGTFPVPQKRRIANQEEKMEKIYSNEYSNYSFSEHVVLFYILFEKFFSYITL